MIPAEKKDNKTDMRNWLKSLFTGSELDDENDN